MNPYVPLLMLFVFAAVFTGGFLLLSQLVGAKSKNPPLSKATSYECGVDPVGSARDRFPVKFYRVAILFILFDVEIIFLYPWAVLFKEMVSKGMGGFLFVEMMIFIGLLGIGLIYVYGSRALDWEK